MPTIASVNSRRVVGSPPKFINGGNLANIAGVHRIKITGKVIMLIGITFAVLTWVLLYGTTGEIGGLVMLFGALSYPVAFGGLVWAAGWIAEGFFHPEV
jgi:hypothetical protein